MIMGSIPLGFSYSDIQSIDATIDLKPYENNQVELNINFFDDKGRDVNQINYQIQVTQDGKTIFESIIYDHDGKAQHITTPLESFSHIEIIIKVRGLGLSQPYTGPTNELFFALSTTSHYLTTYTDKAKYSEGDTMRIYGHASNDDPSVVSMIIKAPNSNLVYIKQATLHNNEFSFDLIAGGEVWNQTGEYVVTVNHGNSISNTGFWFDVTTSIPKNTDSVAPLLLVPSDIIVNTQDGKVRVDYTVKAIDDVDGILQPVCNPLSGTYFGLGDTLVTCSAKDYSGNRAQEKFLVTVVNQTQIPPWIKDVAGFWCSGEIEDESFLDAMSYLVENNVIIVPKITPNSGNSDEIPNWIKNNACWWSDGIISDSDFTAGIQYLISNGIIHV